MSTHNKLNWKKYVLKMTKIWNIFVSLNMDQQATYA